MKKGSLLKIKNNLKCKLNLILIFSILFILTFLYYKGDDYVSNILQEEQSNIVALNIKDPFYESLEETNTQEQLDNTQENQTNIKVENISYQEKNKVADPSTWHWPTTSNYLITTYYSSSHKAIDIYSYDGFNSNIYAANNGEVVEVKGGCIPGNLTCNGSGGNYIIINHNNNNYYTIYMHLNKINVSVGDIVRSGDTIGTMGNTGNVIPVPTSASPYNGTHLHFCLYIGRPFQGGYAVNPMNLY